MKYIVMNLNTLNAIANGVRTSSHLFFVGFDPEQPAMAMWSKDIAEAQAFVSSVQDVWNFLYYGWGYDFARATFAVLSVDDSAIELIDRVNRRAQLSEDFRVDI